MDIRHELKQSIINCDITPYFQPIVDLRTADITGYEILARWKHPQLGTVSPCDFVPLAEEADLMPLLTESLLRSAAVSWGCMPRGINLSLNVSPTQLLGDGLLATLQAVAKETAFSLDQLILEITESALLSNYASAEETLLRLKAAGCKLALDDFGTGYSSMTYLRSLPLDILKIDQSFIRMMLSHREDRKIVGAVVGLGKSLGLKTVAEGVEERSQADMLLQLGCECGQGWLYGKAVPRQEITDRKPFLPPATGSFTREADPIYCMEALPAQSHAQLTAIYNSAPVGLGFFDCNFRFVNLNRRLAALHGLAIDELVGRSFREVDPARFLQVEPYMKRARNGETFESIEFAQPSSACGVLTTHLASIRPALDEVGEVVGILVSVIDITERKQAEVRLAEEHAYLQNVLDALPIGVVIAEAPSGKIVSSNPCSKAILAQNPMHFETIGDYGKRVAYYKDGSRLKSEDFPLARALQKGETTSPDRVFYDMGPHMGKWLDISGAPIRDGRGEVIGAVVALQEVFTNDAPEKDDLVSRFRKLWRKYMHDAKSRRLDFGEESYVPPPFHTAHSSPSCTQPKRM